MRKIRAEFMFYLVVLGIYVKILGAMMSPYLERKKGFFYGLCYYGILFPTATIPIFIGDPVNIIGLFPFYLLAIMISSEGSRVSRFSIALIFYPVFMVFNMITDEIDSFTLNQMSTTTILLIQTGIKIGMALTFYGLSSLVHLKGTETKRRTLPAHLWYLIDLLACMPFASVLFQVTLTDATLTYPAFSDFNIPFLCTLPFVMLSSLGILFLVRLLYHQQELEEEKTFWNMQNLYSRHVEEEHEQIRRLRHDMRNHLQVMMNLPKEEQSHYVEEILKQPAMSMKSHYCDNPIIHTVVALKAYQMEEKGIHFESELIHPEQINLESTKLCSLFGNALDNAIEACEKLPAGCAPFIILKGKMETNLFMMQVKNSFDGQVKKEEGQIRTKKKNENYHGYGLENIRQIAKQNEGTVGIDWTQAEFTLSVTMLLYSKPQTEGKRRKHL